MTNRGLRRGVVWLMLIVAAVSLPAQEGSRDGNSPLSGGDFVMSAGAGIPYYVGTNFASVWGAVVAAEYVIGRTALSHPIELTYGAGAGASAIFGNPFAWSLGPFAAGHFFLGHNFSLYSRLGVSYFRWGANVSGIGQLALLDGIGFWGAGGVEYFLSDQFAIYLEGGWLAPLTAGVRVSL